MKRKKIIGSACILAVFIIFFIVNLIKTQPKSVIDKDIFVESSSTTSNSTVKSGGALSVTVEINGEIALPSVYTLSYGSRVADLINKAGGLTKSADISKLNMAKKLKDEDYIYIPSIVATTAATGVPPSSKTISDKVDINSASIEELDAVSGIGPVTAEKIVTYREKNGSYSVLEDLKKIGGIGDKTLSKIRDKLEAR
ncbi:MAG TPA: helix-hairpin-helix domain-containing protein [Clostridiaceae bacterium]